MTTKQKQWFSVRFPSSLPLPTLCFFLLSGMYSKQDLGFSRNYRAIVLSHIRARVLSCYTHITVCVRLQRIVLHVYDFKSYCYWPISFPPVLHSFPTPSYSFTLFLSPSIRLLPPSLYFSFYLSLFLSLFPLLLLSTSIVLHYRTEMPGGILPLHFNILYVHCNEI